MQGPGEAPKSTAVFQDPNKKQIVRLELLVHLAKYYKEESLQGKGKDAVLLKFHRKNSRQGKTVKTGKAQ